MRISVLEEEAREVPGKRFMLAVVVSWRLIVRCYSLRDATKPRQ